MTIVYNWQLLVTLAMFSQCQSFGLLDSVLNAHDGVKCSRSGGESGNPGFQFRISPKGLDYANHISEKILADYVRSTTISDFDTSYDKGKAKFRNVKITEFVSPSLNFALPVEGGNQISWSATEGKISASGDFSAYKKWGWVKVKASGTLTVTASGVSIFSSAAITSSNSRPKLQQPQSSVDIRALSLKVTGGFMAKLLNWFRGSIANYIKPTLEKQLREAVQKYLEEDVSKKLETFPTDSPLESLPFKVIYSLTSDPRMTSAGGITTSHKGEIQSLESASNQLTFYPHNMQIKPENSKMLYAYVSDYVVNSFLSHARKLNLTEHTFMQDESRFLRTSCSITDTCLGSVFPEIFGNYSNFSSSVRITATSDPKVCFNPENVTVSATAALVVSVNDGADVHQVMSVNLGVTADFSPQFSDNFEKMYGSAKIHSLEFTNFSSSFSDEELIDATMELLILIQPAAEEKANDYLQKGIEIPLNRVPITKCIQLQNAGVQLFERGLKLSFDVEYNNQDSGQ